jgi:hypothetical protein
MIHKIASDFASSPFMIGVMMLTMNIGSRYITHEFSDNDDEYQQNILLRRFAIFAVCFVGTRDLLISLILTAGFVILASGFLRGKSVYAREGMTPAVSTPDLAMRAAAGLAGHVDDPAYDNTVKPIPK